MRRLQFLFTSLFVFVLVAAPVAPAFAAQTAPKAKWTVMVYMSGDNDLESYVVPNIEQELAATGSTTDVQVVTLADRIPGYDTSYNDWSTTKLYHVTKGMKADAASAVKDWGERDMGDPQTLLDFVSWTKANYPANRYALIFWGHGWSWHPGRTMRDDTNADTLDIDEMVPILPALGFMDVVGYDGCNMASIEIFDLWHGHATAVTSSQEFVWSVGLQYDVVLKQLNDTPGMNADQLAAAFSQSASADRTWSAIAVDSRFDALVTAVDRWSVALKNGLNANRKKYDQAFTATRSFWKAPQDKDLYDMAYEIDRAVTDTTIKARSRAVMKAVTDVVLHERHVQSYADVHGITIYHISSLSDEDWPYYHSLVGFAQQTRWDEFLNAYAGAK